MRFLCVIADQLKAFLKGFISFNKPSLKGLLVLISPFPVFESSGFE